LKELTMKSPRIIDEDLTKNNSLICEYLINA
jgi:hypothetical protein